MISKILKIIKKDESEHEYSKRWITHWQYFVMLWCSVFFIVDVIYNKAEHSVELCTTLVVSIAAIFIPYLAKAYFGKRNEEENKIRMLEIEKMEEEENEC